MLPASHPATMPTMTMTMRLSFDRCMGVPLRDSIFGRDVLDVRRLHYFRSATNPTFAAPRRGDWLRRKLEQTSARPGGVRCQRTWPKGRSCIMTNGAASVSGAPMLHGWDNLFILAGSSAATLEVRPVLPAYFFGETRNAVVHLRAAICQRSAPCERSAALCSRH